MDQLLALFTSLEFRFKPRKFIDWVFKSMTSPNQSSDIEKFRLRNLYLNKDDSEDTFLRWMDVIGGPNLREFDLTLYSDWNGILDGTDLVQAFSNCSSLVSLKMEKGIIKSSGFLGFRRLKSLELRKVQFQKSMDMFRNLDYTYPVLEKLVLIECYCSFEGDILTLTSGSLRYLNMNLSGFTEGFRLSVNCPNLTSLILHIISPTYLCFEEMNSLEHVSVWLMVDTPWTVDAEVCDALRNIIGRIYHVKTMDINSAFLLYLHPAIYMRESFPPSFSNLKSLKLSVECTRLDWKEIICLLDWSPKLETCQISYYPMWGTNALLAYADAEDEWKTLADRNISCLKRVEFINTGETEFFKVGDDEDKYVLIQLVRFILMKGQVLQKLSICWKNSFEERMSTSIDKLISKVEEFPASSPHVELTIEKPGYKDYSCFYSKYNYLEEI